MILLRIWSPFYATAFKSDLSCSSTTQWSGSYDCLLNSSLLNFRARSSTWSSQNLRLFERISFLINLNILILTLNVRAISYPKLNPSWSGSNASLSLDSSKKCAALIRSRSTLKSFFVSSYFCNCFYFLLFLYSYEVFCELEESFRSSELLRSSSSFHLVMILLTGS